MTENMQRDSDDACAATVRIQLATEEDLYERYGVNLRAGGIFIADSTPPAVGSRVSVEFVLPHDIVLSRIIGKVVHARRAKTKDDPTAGMGIQFVQYDAAAKMVLQDLGVSSTPNETLDLELEGPVFSEVIGADVVTVRPDEGPVIGIDFGTTNTCAAVVQDGKVHVIESAHGYEIVPSVVYITDDRKVVAGHGAIREMILRPERAIYGFKRFIGRPYESREVQTFGNFFTYNLAPGKSGRAAVKIDDSVVPLEVVAAYVLRETRKMASKHLGQPVHRCVITVPAYFGEIQRQSIRDAAHIAGMKVIRLLSEPTAAAVAYGFGRGLQRNILVYDLGGGTFDASLLQVNCDKVDVLAAQGDPFLGGVDFDDRLTGFLLTSVEDEHGLSLLEDRVAVQRVRCAAEEAKKQLSDSHTAVIDVRYLTQTNSGPFHLNVPIDRRFMTQLTVGLVRRTLSIVSDVLADASMTPDDIESVILVGGQTRSPIVKQGLLTHYGEKITRRVHPDHAVAIGAAIVGGAMAGNVALHLTDILPASIRVGLPDGSTKVLLRRGIRLPAQSELEVPSNGKFLSEASIALFRGEAKQAEHNEPLGRLRYPRGDEPTVDQTAARLLVRVDRDGVLKVVLHQEETQKLVELRVSLTEEDEVLEVDDVFVSQID